MIFDHTNNLVEEFKTLLTQAEEDIAGEAINCDSETEVCAIASTTSATSVYDDVSQATLDAEASLYKWNLRMALAHLSQAAMILVLSQTVELIGDFRLPLVTHFLDWGDGYPIQAT